MEQYKIVKNYRDDDALRLSFDALSRKTFGLTFEDWYQNGFWRENYIPYSVVKGGEVIANVSANTMEFLMQGKTCRVLQLGTVMTAEEHRNQGLIRKLMGEIKADFAGKVDGMFLFAGADVVNFYPKFGFVKAKEFQYVREVCIEAEATAVQISMQDKAAWAQLEDAVCKNACFGQFHMVNYSELVMFYVTKFMQENVYYIKSLDTYVIAEVEDETLFIHGYYAEKQVGLDAVIAAFGHAIKKVTLGFTPQNTEGFTCLELAEDDTNFMVHGEVFDHFDARKCMVPSLAHT